MEVMSDNVTKGLTAALRGLAMRQAAIASNVANVDTPGYKAVRVSFEEQLSQTLLGEGQPPSGPSSIGRSVQDTDLQPVVQPVLASYRNDGNSVDIDQEMLALADTTMRYSAVARLLSERIALMRSVITDGRR